MLDLLAGFVSQLRRSGIDISLTESLDAARAIEHMDLGDRESFKYALAATLVKDHSHSGAFDTVFDIYFASSAYDPAGDIAGELSELDADQGTQAGSASLGQDSGMNAGQGGNGQSLSPEELIEMIYKALLMDDQEWQRQLTRLAVTAFAGIEKGRPVGGVYYVFRTLRNLNLEALTERLVDARINSKKGEVSGLQAKLISDDVKAKIDAFKKEIESEVRRRLVADRGPEAMAKTLRKPLPEDIDFMHANREELASLKRAIQPLSRKLAVKLARKRRHKKRGPLDFRKTVRHSLSYGGVPAELKFKSPRASKPEIVVLADISGSVASFARFTLQMVHTLGTQFSKVRSFVFVDGVDEVTSLIDGSDDIGEAIYRVNTEADVVWVDGHSDYGHVFETFWEKWGKEITPKTSVIVLGDARNNYHASGAWALGEISRKARHLYWLDPETRSYWDTGDSIIGEYAVHCAGVFECRNLRQLEKFVEQLA